MAPGGNSHGCRTIPPRSFALPPFRSCLRVSCSCPNPGDRIDAFDTTRAMNAGVTSHLGVGLRQNGRCQGPGFVRPRAFSNGGSVCPERVSLTGLCAVGRQNLIPPGRIVCSRAHVRAAVSLPRSRGYPFAWFALPGVRCRPEASGSLLKRCGSLCDGAPPGHRRVLRRPCCAPGNM